MNLDISNLKITEEFLAELQQDLEDAATDYGGAMADRTATGEEPEEVLTYKAALSMDELGLAHDRFQLASEKLRRAIEIFAKQKNEV